MRINYEYIKTILDVFLKCKTPTTKWDEFSSLTNDNYDKFIFHLEILIDKGLIESMMFESNSRTSRDAQNIGYSMSTWRLTADGHDFACALEQPSILNVINENFKKEGMSVVIKFSKQILLKKVEKYLE